MTVSFSPMTIGLLWFSNGVVVYALAILMSSAGELILPLFQG